MRACTFFGAGAAFYASCLKAGVEPLLVADLSRFARSARPARPWRLTAIAGSMSGCRRWTGGHLADADQRRHRLCRCFRRWPADLAGGRGRDAMPLPGRRGRSLVRAGCEWPGVPLIDEVGELVCTSRCRRCRCTSGATATARRYHDSYFDMYPGVLAPRRLDPHHAPSAAARSSTAAATPPSTATASAWAPLSCTARWRRCPKCWTAWWSTSNTWAAKAGCRCSWCCAKGCKLDEALT